MLGSLFSLYKSTDSTAQLKPRNGSYPIKSYQLDIILGFSNGFLDVLIEVISFEDLYHN